MGWKHDTPKSGNQSPQNASGSGDNTRVMSPNRDELSPSIQYASPAQSPPGVAPSVPHPFVVGSGAVPGPAAADPGAVQVLMAADGGNVQTVHPPMQNLHPSVSQAPAPEESMFTPTIQQDIAATNMIQFYQAQQMITGPATQCVQCKHAVQSPCV